jgi:DNA-binding NarL/FixJ family response regulator
LNGNTTLPAKRDPRAEQPRKSRQPLTEREAQILQLLREFRAEHGYGASHRDIADQIPWSLGTVAHDMRSLRVKGYIKQPPATPRAAVPVDDAEGAA